MDIRIIRVYRYQDNEPLYLMENGSYYEEPDIVGILCSPHTCYYKINTIWEEDFINDEEVELLIKDEIKDDLWLKAFDNLWKKSWD